MRSIFLTGTAGSGKSLLCSTLAPWFSDKGSTVATVNLDPGASNLPYEPDVDIRDFIDLSSVMDSYALGPNGALIFAADLVATRLEEIEQALSDINPDYAIFDTPGQVELFAYRNSGPYIVSTIESEAKTVLFLFDSTLVSRRDLLGPKRGRGVSWSKDASKLVSALFEESRHTYELDSSVLRSLVKAGIGYELYPVSSVTREGLVALSAIITRQLSGGEESEE